MPNKISWAEKDRPCKALVRKIATEKRHNHTVNQANIMMPGITCLDVKLALQNKTIRTSDFLIVIERNSVIMRTIAEKLSQMGFSNIWFHRGDIHELNLATALNGRKVKYAFLDLCGELGPSVASWLASLDPKCFHRNCRILFTFQFYRSKGNWPAWTNSIDTYLPLPFHRYLETKNKTEWFAARRIKKRILPSSKWQSQISPSIVKDLWLVCRCLWSSLSNFDFNVNNVVGYCDDRNWMFYIDTVFLSRSKNNQLEYLDRCLKDYVGSLDPLSPMPKVIEKYFKSRNGK